MDKIKSNMFESEENVLRVAENLSKNEAFKDNPLLPYFQELTEKYKRILDEIQRIIRISDGQQEYLHKIQLELKKEIKHRISIEEKLSKLASTDSLTGVYNRGTGLSILENMLKNIKRTKSFFSICFLDINDLKYVNDNYGHHEGDMLIIKVCSSFKDVLRESDIICRLGGDEFLIIFWESDEEGVKSVIARLLNDSKFQEIKNSKPYDISFSYGTVEIKENNNLSIDELIELADRRMYLQKEEYKENQKVRAEESK